MLQSEYHILKTQEVESSLSESSLEERFSPSDPLSRLFRNTGTLFAPLTRKS